MFDNEQRPKKQGSEQNAQHCKKETVEKKYKKHLLTFLQETKSTQTTGSVFAERIELVTKSKIELEALKFVQCFFYQVMVLMIVT